MRQWDVTSFVPATSKKIKKKQQPLIQRQYGLKTWITLNIYLGTFNPADRFRKINFPFGGLWHGPCQGSPLAQPLDTCPTFTPEHTIGRITSNLHCESLLKIDSSCPLQNTTRFSPSIYITISYTAVMAGFNPRISLGDPHLNNYWTLRNIEAYLKPPDMFGSSERSQQQLQQVARVIRPGAQHLLWKLKELIRSPMVEMLQWIWNISASPHVLAFNGLF